LKIQEANGPKANVIRVPGKQEGDTLTFKLSVKEMLELAKDSKTGKSEGMMISLTGSFDAEIEGVPVTVNMSQGQGGMGAWTSLKAAKRIV
jgi:hypothetical protein